MDTSDKDGRRRLAAALSLMKQAGWITGFGFDGPEFEVYWTPLGLQRAIELDRANQELKASEHIWMFVLGVCQHRPNQTKSVNNG